MPTSRPSAPSSSPLTSHPARSPVWPRSPLRQCPSTSRSAELAAFPNGIIHLLPEPSAPFEVLTGQLSEAFPECPPYAGEFGAVVPHLTLDALADDVTTESTRQLVGPHLPAHCRAERLDLAWYAPGDCRVLQSWQLGG